MCELMGILTTHEKSDWETITREVFEWRDYCLEYRLREYERYERFLVSRDRTTRRQVHLRAYDRDVSERMEGSMDLFTPIVEQKSTWDKGDGPRGGWKHRLIVTTERVRNRLRARDDTIERFTENIPESVRETDE